MRGGNDGVGGPGFQNTRPVAASAVGIQIINQHSNPATVDLSRCWSHAFEFVVILKSSS